MSCDCSPLTAGTDPHLCLCTGPRLVGVQVLHIREALATMEADIIYEGNRVRNRNAT